MSKLFINITNEPSSQWDLNELSAAEELGKVIDFPPPIITERLEMAQVLNIVDELYKQITDLRLSQEGITPNKDVSVYIMMTGTLVQMHLTKKLLDNNYNVVFTTGSVHDVEQHCPDGSVIEEQVVRFDSFVKLAPPLDCVYTMVNIE